jgi:hypothetical protein
MGEATTRCAYAGETGRLATVCTMDDAPAPAVRTNPACQPTVGGLAPCDNCGAAMRWETSHQRCDTCGHIVPCCEGAPLG